MPDKSGGFDSFINQLKANADKTKKQQEALAELRKQPEKPKEPEKMTADQEKALAVKNFEQNLQGKVHKVPQGNSYTSELQGVDSIGLTTPKDAKNNQQLHVIINYTDDVIARDKEGNIIKDDKGQPKVRKDVPRKYMTTIGKDGVVIGGEILYKRLPKKLQYLNSAKLLNEVVRITNSLDVNKTRTIAADIIVESVEPQETKMKRATKKRKEGEQESKTVYLVDTEPFKIINRNKNILVNVSFEGADEKVSTNTLINYNFFMFPNGVLCRSRYYGSGIYCVKFNSPLTDKQCQLIREGKIDGHELKDLLAEKGFLQVLGKHKVTIKNQMKDKDIWKKQPDLKAPIEKKVNFFEELFDRLEKEGYYETAKE